MAYDTDVDKAMAVIRRAVEDSPYTVAGKPVGEDYEYGPVYFIEYAASSLVMATTVYYEPKNPTEGVKSDINLGSSGRWNKRHRDPLQLRQRRLCRTRGNAPNMAVLIIISAHFCKTWQR